MFCSHAGCCAWPLRFILHGAGIVRGQDHRPGLAAVAKAVLCPTAGTSSDAAALHFPYPFYFSQTLDVDEARQKQLPQGSIRFDQFNGQTVLAISGNYYISYSSELLNRNQRARKTYEDVVLPLLKAAVARSGPRRPV